MTRLGLVVLAVALAPSCSEDGARGQDGAGGGSSVVGGTIGSRCESDDDCSVKRSYCLITSSKTGVCHSPCDGGTCQEGAECTDKAGELGFATGPTCTRSCVSDPKACETYGSTCKDGWCQ